MNRTCSKDRIRLGLAGVSLLLLSVVLSIFAPPARAFCGFYVAQGDAKIYNQSSKVVLVRDGNRTVLTMASDFKGDPKKFAVVIPVPVVLKKEQVHVADPGIVDRLHDYSVPRMVEYWDPNPCPSNTVEVRGEPKMVALKASSSIHIITSEDLRSV